MEINPIPWPILAADDRSPFRRRTYTFHADQLAVLDEALRAAHAAGAHDHTLNANNTANAIIRIAQAYLDGR